MRQECRESFPRHRFQWKPQVSMDHAMRHARAVMHVGIANSRWWGKRSRHSRRMRKPQFYISDKRPIKWCRYSVCPLQYVHMSLRTNILVVVKQSIYMGLCDTCLCCKSLRHLSVRLVTSLIVGSDNDLYPNRKWITPIYYILNPMIEEFQEHFLKSQILLFRQIISHYPSSSIQYDESWKISHCMSFSRPSWIYLYFCSIQLSVHSVLLI